MYGFSFNPVLTLGLSAALALASTGCGGEDDADAAMPGATHIEIQGDWTSPSGSTETIDDESWTTTYGSQAIVEFSNGERDAVLSGPDFSDPEKTVYSRVVWTKPEDGSFYYCTATYGCETPEQTLAGDDDDDNHVCDPPMADETDLDGVGCGGAFPWSMLSQE